MSIPGERSHWTSKESPLVLRNLPGAEFQIEADGQVFALNHDDDDPGENLDRRRKETLVREENPSTGTVVFLMAGKKTLRLTDAASVLAASDIDRIDGLLSQQDAADKLTVEVDSHAITRQELGRLAHLADRHDLAVEIHLRGDG